jgi:hypothetical protein
MNAHSLFPEGISLMMLSFVKFFFLSYFQWNLVIISKSQKETWKCSVLSSLSHPVLAATMATDWQ